MKTYRRKGEKQGKERKKSQERVLRSFNLKWAYSTSP
jgi:hypothetical protein